MAFNDSLERLNAARAQIESGGGEEKVNAQHALGKKTARERIAMLLDEGSFIETDAFIPLSGGGESVVTGWGTVNGRAIYLYAQDFTVVGGSVGEAHAAKVCRLLDLAAKCGAPVVAMCDSGGARLNEGPAALNAYAGVMAKSAKLSGVVPQICAVMGPCVGGAAVTAALSDVVVMSQKGGKLLSAPPQVIAAKRGGDAAKIGGADKAGEQGLCHIACPDDETAIAAIRLLLDFLPSNSLDESPYSEPCDINALIAGWDGDVLVFGKTLVSGVADNGAYIELSAGYAKERLVTCFARINGQAVGVIAPAEGGSPALCPGACWKAARFIRLCDAFNMPVVTFVDFEGLLVVSADDDAAVIQSAAQLTYAYAEASVPMVSVITGAAVGAAYAVMGAKASGADMVFAWPQAKIAVAASETAARILYKDDLKAGTPVTELVARFENEDAGPLRAAAAGLVDNVIKPSQTRKFLAYALDMLLSKQVNGPARKHGNMPL